MRLGAADDLAILLYTSGTTARPKGCMHSHAALLHVAASRAGSRFELTAEDRFWSPLPPFHVGGIDTVLCALVAGCAFVHPGLFTPEVAVDQLVAERCTVAFPASQTMWLAVLDEFERREAGLDDLRLVVNVGVPERLRAIQERLPGATQVAAVGMTEAAGFISVGVVGDPRDERVRTGGHPLPGMEVVLRGHGRALCSARATPGSCSFVGCPGCSGTGVIRRSRASGSMRRAGTTPAIWSGRTRMGA